MRLQSWDRAGGPACHGPCPASGELQEPLASSPAPGLDVTRKWERLANGGAPILAARRAGLHRRHSSDHWGRGGEGRGGDAHPKTDGVEFQTDGVNAASASAQLSLLYWEGRSISAQVFFSRRPTEMSSAVVAVERGKKNSWPVWSRGHHVRVHNYIMYANWGVLCTLKKKKKKRACIVLHRFDHVRCALRTLRPMHFVLGLPAKLMHPAAIGGAWVVRGQ